MSNEAPLSRDRTAGILRPCLFGKLSHLNRSTSSCTDFPSSARSYFDIFDLQEILKVRCELMAWTQSIHQPERRTLEEESDLLYMTVLICINADEQVSHLTNVPLGIPCVHIQSLANQKVPKPYTMPYFLHCWALLVVLDRKKLLSEAWILGPSWTLNPKSRFFASESGFDHGQFRQRPHSIKPNNDSCIPVYWRKIRKGSQREDCGSSNAPSKYRWLTVRCHMSDTEYTMDATW